MFRDLRGGPIIFQSTLSVRRATLALIGAVFRYRISIHALREESDVVYLQLPV